ncbi:hypothetical protein [Neorhizobium sp. T6_25]|uniref:hypothetical protein n=1 Tax=Neorhizobium sp. T6_25 TaxID=2093833 RepID=UPI000CF934F6|nr:hypothetical protein [Neorhizobium sp. T6_25]
MECTFQVGQKVVCVDDRFTCGWDRIVKTPVKGQVYTIRQLFTFKACTGPVVTIILLDEIVNPVRKWDAGVMEAGFVPRRFRPVVERKTDISIFTALLTSQPEQVPA